MAIKAGDKHLFCKSLGKRGTWKLLERKGDPTKGPCTYTFQCDQCRERKTRVQ